MYVRVVRPDIAAPPALAESGPDEHAALRYDTDADDKVHAAMNEGSVR